MKYSRITIIIGLIAIVANIAFNLFHFGGDYVLIVVSDLFPVVCAMLAMIGLIASYKSFKQFDLIKISWLLILIGIVLYFLAECIYAILELVYHLDMNESFPTIADLFWLVGYLPFFAGFILIIYGYKKSGLPFGSIKIFLCIAILFLILAVALIYELLFPIFKDSESSFLQKFVYLFYPIGDLFLVVPAAFIFYITSFYSKGKISRPWRYISLGFVFIAMGDIAYSYLSWHDLYGSGSMSDVSCNFGYILIAIGAWFQKELIESL